MTEPFSRWWTALAIVLVVSAVGMADGGAASSPGVRTSGSGVSAGRAACLGYHRPVDGPVVDPFRLPEGHYGAGNRGLEYATVPGAPARAVAAGEVTFAGAVAGRLSVTIRHADGRRSSLSGLASVIVRTGDLVPRAAAVATTGPRTHLGVREGDRYVDPAPLLCEGRRRAVLVPLTP